MFRLLHLNNLPILEQLQLEEALLRGSEENWCIINTGSTPAIVMGISGKVEKLVDRSKVAQAPIPIIKRFSGGGTVVIDSHTLFVTWICQKESLPVAAQPKPILVWSERVYQTLFKGFSLRENDYVFGEKKFGGNALYIQKNRWLLHTSFLWDYTPGHMEYLLLPEKRPSYRGERSHTDFLCTLKPLFPYKQQLVDALITQVRSLFSIERATLQEASLFKEQAHRTSTTLINI